MFHPEYNYRTVYAAFLRRAVEEISSPVLPNDTHLEYLPTQVLGEYLAHFAELRFDGLIYASSQTEGRNVVLFNHASGIEPLGHEYEVDADWPIRSYPYNLDREDPTIKMDRRQEEDACRGDDERGHDELFTLDIMDVIDSRQTVPFISTLRLDPATVRVLSITAAGFRTFEPTLYVK